MLSELRVRGMSRADLVSRMASSSVLGIRSHLERTFMCGSSSFSMQERDRREPEMNFAVRAKRADRVRKLREVWF